MALLPFHPLARALTIVVQGTVFSVIGFLAGVTGTAVSNGLLLLRKQLDPNFKLVVGGWGSWGGWLRWFVQVVAVAGSGKS